MLSSLATTDNLVGASLLGGLASSVIVVLWLYSFHYKFFESLYKTDKHNAYGVYTTFGEALRTHFWYLVPGVVNANQRDALEAQVQDTFLHQTGASQEETERRHVLVTHSCRSIFYYMIRTLLEEAQEKRGEMKIKIALPAVHFGSFYKLLKGMEKSMKCTIDFYEIDLKPHDWTLDQESIDEEQFKTCDLVLCQHLFGVPFEQSKMWELAQKYNIPLLEDLVQSGSLYGKYKGNPMSDMVMYSGGLDKTPQCFGAGLGHFRNTPHGNHYYAKCKAYHESLPLDSRKRRFIGCFNCLAHLLFAQDVFNINCLLGLFAYVWTSERGDYISWHALALKIRRNKAIAPFQHAESGFLRRPSAFQLRSIMYGLVGKMADYNHVAQEEIRKRQLYLDHIPKEYQRLLFPWWTPEILQAHNDNGGICEFSWVVSPWKDRMGLCQYLNDHFIVTLINTTWEYDEQGTNNSVSKDINENLIYLPNMNHLEDRVIIHIANALTKYCDSQKGHHVPAHKK